MSRKGKTSSECCIALSKSLLQRFIAFTEDCLSTRVNRKRRNIINISVNRYSVRVCFPNSVFLKRRNKISNFKSRIVKCHNFFFFFFYLNTESLIKDSIHYATRRSIKISIGVSIVESNSRYFVPIFNRAVYRNVLRIE